MSISILTYNMYKDDVISEACYNANARNPTSVEKCFYL